jgi:hypothetical protein
MCFSGGFALAMALDEVVAAPVLCEPSMPIALPWARADIGLSPQDATTLKRRAQAGLEVRGYRFTCDRISPAERFETLTSLLGAQFKGCQIDSGPGNPDGIARSAHAVMTVHRVDNPNHPTAKALEDVLSFFETKLKPTRSVN